jgi:hypothetical protein
VSKLIVLTVLVASFMAQAESKSNLAGVWKMDPNRSDFGPGPVSVSRLDRITLEEATLKDTITQMLSGGKELTYDMIYSLDGKESTNQVNGRTVKSTARWEGAELVVESHMLGAQMNDRWTVSPDGKTLTLVRHITGMRHADQKVVFDRQ